MIYFTGDTHQNIDVHKLSTTSWPEQKNLTKDDYLIILGDFGCVWDGGKNDLWWQKWHNSKPYTTLFVPGNHENYDLLRQYPEEEWNGGIVRRIQPSVLMLERGYIFDIDGLKIFTMGGAKSHDADMRVYGLNMWHEEMPSQEEYNRAARSLQAADYKVDLILTHCAPTETEIKMLGGLHDGGNKLTSFLQRVDDTTEYRGWLFGHYHQDGYADAKHLCLYQRIISLNQLFKELKDMKDMEE